MKDRKNDTPIWFQNPKTVNEVEFCREFLTEHNLKCINGNFYDTDGIVSDDSIRYEIMQKLLSHYTSGLSIKVKNLIETLKLLSYSEFLPIKQNEIYTQNGTLYTDRTFRCEKNFCQNRLNINYNPDIWNGVYYPEKFLTFLYDLLEAEDVVTLQEYLGYCLIPSTKGQTAMFIIGNGGEGKSRIGIVLKEIFGETMITASFQKLENSRFFLKNLENKLLMVDDDMQLEALKSTGVIKTLITAETPMDVEEKGKQSYQANIYTRLLCFGNGSPKTLYDKSDGFARRLIILTAKPKPPNRIDDPFICDKFIAEKEKIFCWMFDGLCRLIGNNFKFTVSDKAKENVKTAMIDNCNIIEFMKDVTFDKSAEITSTRLYDKYCDWCYDNGMTALKRETFIGWLKTNENKYGITYSMHIYSESGKRVRGFKGLK